MEARRCKRRCAHGCVLSFSHSTEAKSVVDAWTPWTASPHLSSEGGATTAQVGQAERWTNDQWRILAALAAFRHALWAAATARCAVAFSSCSSVTPSCTALAMASKASVSPKLAGVPVCVSKSTFSVTDAVGMLSELDFPARCVRPSQRANAGASPSGAGRWCTTGVCRRWSGAFRRVPSILEMNCPTSLGVGSTLRGPRKYGRALKNTSSRRAAVLFSSSKATNVPLSLSRDRPRAARHATSDACYRRNAAAARPANGSPAHCVH